MTTRAPLLALTALTALVLGLNLAHPAQVSACATCAAGDPTLTTVGLEKPFAGRLRLSLTARLRWEQQGDPQQPDLRSRELRFDLNTTYAPARWLTLGLVLPVVHRDLTLVSGRHQSAVAFGDVAVFARMVVWKDHDRFPNHLLAIQPGFEAPSSPTVFLPDGSRASSDLQAGRGSWVPSLGVSYSYFASGAALFASATAQLPVGSRFEEKAGFTFLATVLGQAQPWEPVAFQLGLDIRVADANTSDGEIVPNTGGFALFLSPGIAVHPGGDLLLSLTVRVPVLSLYRGQQQESPVFSLAVAYDFETQ